MSSSKGHLEDRDSRSPEKGKFIKKKHKSRSPRRHGKRRSRGSSIDSNSSTDSSPDYKKSKKQRRKGNSSDNNASSTSSPDCKKPKKHKSKKKHKKHDKKKKHKKSKKKSKEKKNLLVTADVQEQTTSAVANEDSDVIVGPDPEQLKAKAMAPMTKEEWDKQQSVVRRVYDEESGRYRLIKGGGEVIEEIVSLQRHKEINKKATQGDGAYFQSVLGLNSQK